MVGPVYALNSRLSTPTLPADRDDGAGLSSWDNRAANAEESRTGATDPVCGDCVNNVEKRRSSEYPHRASHGIVSSPWGRNRSLPARDSTPVLSPTSANSLCASCPARSGDN